MRYVLEQKGSKKLTKVKFDFEADAEDELTCQVSLCFEVVLCNVDLCTLRRAAR